VAVISEPGATPRVLRGRRIVLGVSGGISAYKTVEVCRRLVDAGAFVSPVLTADALRFVGAATFSAVASEPARTSLFDAPEPIPHTRLGRLADVVIVAPATANLLGKYANGLADDLLTATLLATRAPVLVAPAMHTEMWEHAAVQDNIARLRARGVHVVGPGRGHLAGGDEGTGRMAEPAEIVTAAAMVLESAVGNDLAGLRVLVTAGGTREPVDAVRVLTNRSSGKQGYAIAEAAAARGAAVTLVTTIGRRPEHHAIDVVDVATTVELEAAVMSRAAECDVIVQAAAVADFRPKAPVARKITKEEGLSEIVLEPTHDFSIDLGRAKPPGQVLVGFAAETDDLVASAERKLRRKGLDLIVANDVAASDSGFEVDTNRAVLVSAAGDAEELPLLSKRALAERILDRVSTLVHEQRR
jgi:phosphopantothenoylcysteine decarboxylase/phosphopantothenate--cysteine ligase